jgi:hypothetical protein
MYDHPVAKIDSSDQEVARMCAKAPVSVKFAHRVGGDAGGPGRSGRMGGDAGGPGSAGRVDHAFDCGRA